MILLRQSMARVIEEVDMAHRTIAVSAEGEMCDGNIGIPVGHARHVMSHFDEVRRTMEH